jgi:hypothetical protein
LVFFLPLYDFWWFPEAVQDGFLEPSTSEDPVVLERIGEACGGGGSSRASI